MLVVKCPKCGAVLHTDEMIPVQQLSPAAQHVLQKAPRRFLDGNEIPLREISRVTGYSIGRVHFALLELTHAGYIERIPRGQRKHVYRGIPEVARV